MTPYREFVPCLTSYAEGWCVPLTSTTWASQAPGLWWRPQFPQPCHSPALNSLATFPNYLRGKQFWAGLQGNVTLTPTDLSQALGRRWPAEAGSKAPIRLAHRGPSVSVLAVTCPFCFAGFSEHGFISCDCAISGGVNIAGGLFKKANDLKCLFLGFFPPFLFHLNYLQETEACPSNVQF